MSLSKCQPKRTWKKFVQCRCGFGQSAQQTKPVDSITLVRPQETMEQSHILRKPHSSEHPAHHSSPAVVPELAHLTARGQNPPHKPRLAFLHRQVVKEEDPHRALTPSLAARKMFGKKVAGNSQHPSNDDEHNNEPEAVYMPRSHELIMTQSRNHLKIVPKSPLSPLNDCSSAPENQVRRRPARLQMSSVTEAQLWIESFAKFPSLLTTGQTPPPNRTIQPVTRSCKWYAIRHH
ncbi:hypothetical protein BU23DRAFT_137860 [Bimuria novae-zelandiae CBS 107.79]|uniref:Uncharacterized protein n=1 Tax=Bimuria novae-zelandiae CBS 107.79 TaxID=1447943 RepID=A0A6A5VJ65_9PLEO|nr:hypothetical protein BU23DRAFT_137860 [Bimuria novae-zelandiae CBS 107.79]